VSRKLATEGNNPQTGTFYKLSDFPSEYRKNKEDKLYPIKQANQIIRIKTAKEKCGSSQNNSGLQ
jgi:hypothetical protein